MQKYFLSEIFFSLNGEGLQSGMPTGFIRLAGCNLRCNWCDTSYARTREDQVSLDDIVDEIEDFSTNWICITGGEPLLQDIAPLVEALPHNVALETNGTIYKDVIKDVEFVSVDLKTPSSGMQIDLPILQKILDTMEEGQLKAVISDRDDYLFVKNVLRQIDLDVPLILQPNFHELQYKKLFSIYREDPIDHDLRILTQLHKLGDLR